MSMKQGEREAMLLKMTVEEAREAQFQHGLEKYGEAGNWKAGNFVGNPLAHMFTELIDAMNYATVAHHKGMMDACKLRLCYDMMKVLAEAVQCMDLYQ